MKNSINVALVLIAATVVQSLWADVIDFENIPGVGAPTEGLVIDTQYQDTEGITFSREDGGAPVIADVGGTKTAFGGPPNHQGPDTPLEGQGIGAFFLTDDGSLVGLEPPALIVTYDTPTAEASGFFLDLDFDERFTVELVGEEDQVLDSLTVIAGGPNTGDGVATLWSFKRAAADVHQIRFRGSRPNTCGVGNEFGWGFDNFDPRSAAPSKGIHFAQAVQGDGSYSEVVLWNPTQNPVAGIEVQFLASDGTTSGSQKLDLSASESRVVRFDGAESLEVGHLAVLLPPGTPEGQIQATEFISLTIDDQALSPVGVRPAQFCATPTAPIVSNEMSDTGFSFANFSQLLVNCEWSVFEGPGEVVGSNEFAVPAGGKVQFFPSVILGVETISGHFVASCGNQILTVALQQFTDGTVVATDTACLDPKIN